MAVTFVGGLTGDEYDSPLLVVDSDNNLAFVADSDPAGTTTFYGVDITNRNLPVVDFSYAHDNTANAGTLDPTDGFIYGNEVWVSSAATGTNSGIWVLRRNDLGVKERIYDSVNSGRNTSLVTKMDGRARYKNYLYVPSGDSDYVAVINMDTRSVVAEIVLETEWMTVDYTPANALHCWVHGCWLFIGTENTGLYSYFLGNDPESPDLGEWRDQRRAGADPSGDMTPTNTAADYTWADGTVPQRTRDGSNIINDLRSIWADGDYLYTYDTDASGYFIAFDISNPLAMDYQNYYWNHSEGLSFVLFPSQEEAILASDAGNEIIVADTTTKSSMSEKSSVTDATYLPEVKTIRKAGKYYFTVSENGASSAFAVWDSGHNVDSIFIKTNIQNYNDNPPPDDGTDGCNNLVTWNRHMEELTDPLKDGIVSLDRNINSAINELVKKIGVNKYSPCFSANMGGTDQEDIETKEWTKLLFGTVEFDNSGDYNEDESIWTPSERGKYKIGLYYMIDPNSTGSGNRDYRAAIYKNGEYHKQIQYMGSSNIGKLVSESGSVVVEANGCSDYFEAYIWHSSPADEQVLGQTYESTFWGYRAI